MPRGKRTQYPSTRSAAAPVVPPACNQRYPTTRETTAPPSRMTFRGPNRRCRSPVGVAELGISIELTASDRPGQRAEAASRGSDLPALIQGQPSGSVAATAQPYEDTKGSRYHSPNAAREQ